MEGPVTSGCADSMRCVCLTSKAVCWLVCFQVSGLHCRILHCSKMINVIHFSCHWFNVVAEVMS